MIQFQETIQFIPLLRAFNLGQQTAVLNHIKFLSIPVSARQAKESMGQIIYKYLNIITNLEL